MRSYVRGWKMLQLLLGLILIIFFPSETNGAGKMYTSVLDSHCTSWNLSRILGKKSSCRSRAKRMSQAEVGCRLKKVTLNKNDSTMTDCIYERAGYNLGSTTVTLEENGICPRTIKCKRN